ncbi:MAG: nickel pincer cofactor biosynthesis protein LarB [Ferrimicrobium sp.]
MVGGHDESLVRSEYGWFDRGRIERIGIPEAIYAAGKSDSQLHALVHASLAGPAPTIVTRLAPERLEDLALEGVSIRIFPELDAGSAYVAVVANAAELRQGFRVAIMGAGSSDLLVMEEAHAVLYALGIQTQLVLDCGVASPARTIQALSEVAGAACIVVVAGFEGALATVVGSATAVPVVAVPTSVGYGVCREGETALAAMLASCAAGIAVVGIDNGFGAGCAAARIVGARGCG